jgi:hypothetical protein
MDSFVVALMINKSVEVFASLLGAWIPFMLIFTAAYATGVYGARAPKHKAMAL